ncbi:DUF5317 family protein [Actinomarinicola tropica]|uniref:Uncharacterized protein n=1 Tax=Actinomarinicola tropica TaxID=2789776 RepID=A0A5Q2RFP5_9ACTN|nr:DUF5317 family protein [Actinomarinicola tropica]QGG94523.1 hypothetical protein GH723_05060 [Actinomarinicola tropica]
MTVIVGALVIGCAIGLCRGGRIRHLTRVDLRWVPLGAFGVAATTWASVGASRAPELLLATGLVATGAAALRNARIVGLGVAGVGLLLVAAPLLANGAVPVDRDALVHAGQALPAAPGDELPGGRRLADDTTLLAPLGATIPVPELGLVLSFGDLIAAVGVADAVQVSMRRRRPGGVPVAEIFAADAAGSSPAVRRERPVEVRPGRPVPIPMGWGRPDDEGADLVAARPGREPRARSERAAAHRTSSTHVPWPWRRTPPPRPHHPTMRVGRDGT